jgi:hypothetical protein
LSELLFVRADSLAASRRRAAEGGRSTLERHLLARGEALAESIRAVAAARLAQELLCEPLASALIEHLDAQLIRPDSSARQAPRDSLLELRGRLRREQIPAARLGLLAPQAEPEDPPEVLRQKAAYARDLVDRAERWRAMVSREAQRLADRARVAQELRALLGDEQFFAEGPGFESQPWDLPGGSEALGAEEFAGRGGDLLVALIAQMPERPEAESVEEVLEILETWLARRASELERRAAEFEAEALRREREP